MEGAEVWPVSSFISFAAFRSKVTSNFVYSNPWPSSQAKASWHQPQKGFVNIRIFWGRIEQDNERTGYETARREWPRKRGPVGTYPLWSEIKVSIGSLAAGTSRLEFFSNCALQMGSNAVFRVPMKHRVFGKDGAAISEVGLGCWQLGGDWGTVEDRDAANILKASYEEGVTFFDTADVYGGGRSERIVGDFLKEIDDERVFVATKVGRGDIYPDGYSKTAIRSRIEASLERLGVKALDLVQTHCAPTELMRSGEIYEWLQALVDEGLIRRYGASVETADEAVMLIENCEGLYSLQVIFNIFRQKPIDAFFEKAKNAGVGLIARVPLASGTLSGKFSADTHFVESDHRNYNKDGDAFNVGETFAGVPFDRAIELAERMKPLDTDGIGMARMALRWILDFEAVTTVIPGATRAEQARSNASVSELSPLSKKTHEALRTMYESEIASLIRGAY